MAIKSIEIICIPCPKCEFIEKKLRETIRAMEINYKIKIHFDFKHTVDIRDINKYGLNPSQTPVVLVNGSVEFAGKIEAVVIKNRLDSIHRGY